MGKGGHQGAAAHQKASIAAADQAAQTVPNAISEQHQKAKLAELLLAGGKATEALACVEAALAAAAAAPHLLHLRGSCLLASGNIPGGLGSCRGTGMYQHGALMCCSCGCTPNHTGELQTSLSGPSPRNQRKPTKTDPQAPLPASCRSWPPTRATSPPSWTWRGSTRGGGCCARRARCWSAPTRPPRTTAACARPWPPS
jgi:hypothetical protein